MLFLDKLGFKTHTIDLITPYVINEKGKLIFPFSFYKYEDDISGETIFVDGNNSLAKDGLFIIDPCPQELKTNILFFDSVLNMLAYSENINVKLLSNSLLVVIPVLPKYKTILLLLTDFPFCCYFTLVFSNDLGGICKDILITAYINAYYDISIRLYNDKLLIQTEFVSMLYDIEKFNFKKFIKDFSFPKRITLKKPKGFISYSHKFYNNGR